MEMNLNGGRSWRSELEKLRLDPELEFIVRELISPTVFGVDVEIAPRRLQLAKTLLAMVYGLVIDTTKSRRARTMLALALTSCSSSSFLSEERSLASKDWTQKISN